MKLAQIMAGAPEGGAELFYERLCVALAQAGDTVTPVIRRDPARAARLTQAGLAPVQMGFGGLADVWTRPLLGRALRRLAPRVAVAWMGRAARHAPSGPWVLVGRLGGYYGLGQFARCDHLVGNTQGMVDWIRAQGFRRTVCTCWKTSCPTWPAPRPPACRCRRARRWCWRWAGCIATRGSTS